MVRDTDKGAKLAAKHASVRLVYGDLDNTKMIEEEARRADVVLSALLQIISSPAH